MLSVGRTCVEQPEVNRPCLDSLQRRICCIAILEDLECTFALTGSHSRSIQAFVLVIEASHIVLVFWKDDGEIYKENSEFRLVGRGLD